eukprot:SAG11_NODE_396_length_9806_cov_37.601855_4_plen_155_part_00
MGARPGRQRREAASSPSLARLRSRAESLALPGSVSACSLWRWGRCSLVAGGGGRVAPRRALNTAHGQSNHDRVQSQSSLPTSLASHCCLPTFQTRGVSILEPSQHNKSLLVLETHSQERVEQDLALQDHYVNTQVVGNGGLLAPQTPFSYSIRN